MTTKKGAFKAKGANILKTKPASMKELLDDKPDQTPEPDAQLHNGANAQMQNSTNKTERLHDYIRFDLADKVHDEIRRRKRQHTGQSISKRAVVEDALEQYFS